MRNTILKMARVFGVMVAFVWLGAMPVMGQSCVGWEYKDADYWFSMTPEKVRNCLDSGASVNAHGKLGLTPLHSAVYASRAFVIIELLDAGGNINAQADGDVTPLHLFAYYSEFTRVLEILLKAGADVNFQDTDGRTPLHYAAVNGPNSGIIIELIKAGADGKIKDSAGNTPFDLVLDNKRLKANGGDAAFNAAFEALYKAKQ